MEISDGEEKMSENFVRITNNCPFLKETVKGSLFLLLYILLKYDCIKKLLQKVRSCHLKGKIPGKFDEC